MFACFIIEEQKLPPINNIDENIKNWGLTNREGEIAKMIIDGKSTIGIAKELFVEKRTIETTFKIFTKNCTPQINLI